MSEESVEGGEQGHRCPFCLWGYTELMILTVSSSLPTWVWESKPMMLLFLTYRSPPYSSPQSHIPEPLAQWFSTGGDFASRGQLAISVDIFDCHYLGRKGAPGIRWAEARDATRHPTLHRTAPATEKEPDPDVCSGREMLLG